MRQRATFCSSSSGPERPVDAPARRQWRNLYNDYERRLLLGAAVLLALLAAAPYFTGSPASQAISSGDPLLNAAGEVVGIVSAMLDPGGGGFAGIGFAVPIETASAAAGTPPF